MQCQKVVETSPLFRGVRPCLHLLWRVATHRSARQALSMLAVVYSYTWESKVQAGGGSRERLRQRDATLLKKHRVVVGCAVRVCRELGRVHTLGFRLVGHSVLLSCTMPHHQHIIYLDLCSSGGQGLHSTRCRESR